MIDATEGQSPLGAAYSEILARLQSIKPHSEYELYPVGWIRDKLGVPEELIRWSMVEGYAAHKWDGDKDPLVLVADALVRGEDVGVESGTGTGKSFFAACVILWFLACFRDARVFTYAPKESQLRLFIWQEMSKLWPRFQTYFPSAELTDLRIRMVPGSDSWGAWGESVGVRADEAEGSASKAQGRHAEHMLLVYEEMPGIPSSVIEAGKQTSTAPHNLRLGLGNPNHRLDTLHQFCESAGVTPVRISALDHPNIVTGNPDVVRGAVAQKSIDRRKADDGEDSPRYKSRVRGISPEQASDALIKLSWLEAAAARFEERRAKGTLRDGHPAMGVDAANSLNGDKAAIADGCGPNLLRVRAFPCPDSNLLGDQVVREAKAQGLEAVHVGVDPVGVGAGTVNEARRQEFTVRSLNGAEKPRKRAQRSEEGVSYEWLSDANKFKTLRAQMYWQFREDLRRGFVAMEKNIEVWKQLVEVRYEDTAGEVKVESKDDIKSRMGGGSPNEADAIIYWNWVRPRSPIEHAVDDAERDRRNEDMSNRSLRWTYENGRVVRQRPKNEPIDEWDDSPPLQRYMASYRKPRFIRG